MIWKWYERDMWYENDKKMIRKLYESDINDMKLGKIIWSDKEWWKEWYWERLGIWNHHLVFFSFAVK